MSPEEAAAQADALIAQYRSTTPRRARAKDHGAPVRTGNAMHPRPDAVPATKALLDDRIKAALVLVLGTLAGYLWKAQHAVWGALFFVCGIGVAFALAARARAARPIDDADR